MSSPRSSDAPEAPAPPTGTSGGPPEVVPSPPAATSAGAPVIAGTCSSPARARTARVRRLRWRRRYHHPSRFSRSARTKSAAAASPTSRSVLAVAFSDCEAICTCTGATVPTSVTADQVKSPPPLRNRPGRSMFNRTVRPSVSAPPPAAAAAAPRRSSSPSLSARVSSSSRSATARSTRPATSQVCRANSARRRSSKPAKTSGPAISARTDGSSSALPKGLDARSHSRLSASRAGPVTSQPASARSCMSICRSPSASEAARSRLTPTATTPEPFSATSMSTPTPTLQAVVSRRVPRIAAVRSCRRGLRPPRRV